MRIYGFQKTTLLDYPGHVAATVFTGGCNFCCPYCHNKDLINPRHAPGFTEDEVLAVLNKRRNILEGICITGGETTLQPGLESFIRKVRSLGLAIKLDTNGYRPQVLKSLCRQNLIDYVAMDIKAGPQNYARACGLPSIDLALIQESIDFLKSVSFPAEFRTTAVKGIHCQQDFREIGPWLEGARFYYLQNYVDSEQVLCPGFSGFTPGELLSFLDLVKPFAAACQIRGLSTD